MSLLDRVLDASVVRSFDQSGFLRHARAFLPGDLEVSLAGKTVLVTGANAGLGLATVAGLAQLGARVVMLCRDQQRGERARAELRGQLEVQRLDVSKLADVRRFAEQWSGPVDVLVHNAGVLPLSRQSSAEGHELTFATNLLGPHLLTSLLLERLRASRGRVVLVSSGGLYTQKLNLAVLQGQTPRFDGVVAYAQTKRAQLIVNEQWAERVPEVTFSAMHPGWADTAGVRTSLPRFHALTRKVLRTAEQGADTTVWLAACARQRGVSGRFWFDRAQAPTHLLPWTKERSEDRDALWARCERLTAA